MSQFEVLYVIIIVGMSLYLANNVHATIKNITITTKITEHLFVNIMFSPLPLSLFPLQITNRIQLMKNLHMHCISCSNLESS